MNPISVPLVLAKTLLDVGLGTVAALSFGRTGKSGGLGIASISSAL
jgi:hypothetical protein